MQMLKYSLLKYSLLTTVLAATAVAGPVFTVDPTPLTANNGTFGWGFSLTNDSSSFLSVDSVQLASPVDDPFFRFGPALNFTELFATYQFNAPTILIAPNSTFSLAYDGAERGLATWAFPNGFDTYGLLSSNVFQIAVGYSLYDDDGYNAATLGGDFTPVIGTITAGAQLQYAPEPSSWLLLATGIGLLLYRRSRTGMVKATVFTTPRRWN
jgi:hypothetical protein